MKAISNVGECEGKAMNAPRELLESCWMLVDQEMMLDVAATVAATQPDIAATLTKPVGAAQALSLHRAERELEMKRAS